ncbi:MAG: hypothetical protein U1C57_03960, partial [Candidatus Doudnabacteria bacterium]|nr:hypothetical protein [Candidatus Doudnabacteria bacterium]
KMVRVAEANPTVGIVGAYRLDQTKVNLDGLPYPSSVVPGRQVCRATLLGKVYVFGSPTSLLFRSDLIREREIFFDESSGSIHVDIAACYEVLRVSDFGFVHQVLTYTRRPGKSDAPIHRWVNSYVAGELLCLKKYGLVFLDPTEYKERLNQLFDRYYMILGEAILRRRDKQFWEYHRNALERLGHPLSRIRLLRSSISEVKNFLFSFFGSLQRVFRLVYSLVCNRVAA